MIKVEFWGPTRKSYGPVLTKKSEVNCTPKDAYNLVKEELRNQDIVGWIKLFINGKFVPSYSFLQQYERNNPGKPNLKIYVEFPSGKFVLMDGHKEVFIGNKEEVEKYLDEHGYFSDDEPKFSI